MYPTMTSVQKELKKIYTSDSYYKLFHVLIIKYILTFAWLNRAGNRESSDVVRELDDMIFKYVEKKYVLDTGIVLGMLQRSPTYDKRRDNFTEFYVKSMNSGFSKSLGNPAKIREFILGVCFECRSIMLNFTSDADLEGLPGSVYTYLILIDNVIATVSKFAEKHIPDVDNLDGKVYSMDIVKLNHVIESACDKLANRVQNYTEKDNMFLEFDITYVKNFFKQFGLII